MLNLLYQCGKDVLNDETEASIETAHASPCLSLSAEPTCCHPQCSTKTECSTLALSGMQPLSHRLILQEGPLRLPHLVP